MVVYPARSSEMKIYLSCLSSHDEYSLSFDLWFGLHYLKQEQLMCSGFNQNPEQLRAVAENEFYKSWEIEPKQYSGKS